MNAAGRVFEHGWQSFSPTTSYRLGAIPHRPVSERNRLLNYRQSSHPGTAVFLGEGLLAVDDGSGTVHVIAAEEPFTTGVRVRAEQRGSRVVISADGAVEELTVRAVDDAGTDAIQGALAQWASAAAGDLAAPTSPPTAWCSWYEYYADVAQRDIDENVAAMRTLDLDIDVVQLDDGYEREIGDWLTSSERFTNLRAVVDGRSQ